MCWLFICFMNLINAGSVEHIKNVQSRSIIRHQHVTVTPVTIICVAYDKNTFNIQISVQMYMIQPLGVTFDLQINYNIIHF